MSLLAYSFYTEYNKPYELKFDKPVLELMYIVPEANTSFLNFDDDGTIYLRTRDFQCFKMKFAKSINRILINNRTPDTNININCIIEKWGN